MVEYESVSVDLTVFIMQGLIILGPVPHHWQMLRLYNAFDEIVLGHAGHARDFALRQHGLQLLQQYKTNTNVDKEQ